MDIPERSSAASPASTRVGFLGLGIMGSRMAACLRRAGFALTVWTHTPGKAERWAAEHGARAVPSPSAAAADSDILVSIVVDGPQVHSVLLGPGGALEGAAPGLLCVDMSTISPTDTRAIGARLAERGLHMLDAPVTGSSPRAENGTLTIMAGGTPADFARALPLLEAMGELVVHVGGLGQGEMLKLINNGLAAANASALAEALLLGSATDIDTDAMLSVLGAGSGASAQLALKAIPMLEHHFDTLFKAEHMLKDVRLCLEQAAAAGLTFPAVAHARDLLEDTVAQGHGAYDYSALVQVVESRAGRSLR